MARLVKHRLRLRLDRSTGTHMFCSVFMNGALCGRLTFTREEYSTFLQALSFAARHLKDPLTTYKDANGWVDGYVLAVEETMATDVHHNIT